jgi:hypothetical protein
MQPDAKQLKTISKMVEDGDIKPIVDLIYSFEDGIDAYISATGRAKGKVISMSKLFKRWTRVTVFLYKEIFNN